MDCGRRAVRVRRVLTGQRLLRPLTVTQGPRDRPLDHQLRHLRQRLRPGERLPRGVHRQRGDDRGDVPPVPGLHQQAQAGRQRSYGRPRTVGQLARGEWPTLEDLEEARRRDPQAMFPDAAAYDAAAPSWDEQEEVTEVSMIWRMEREGG